MTEPKRVYDELVEFVAEAILAAHFSAGEGFRIENLYARAAIKAIQEWDAREVKNG